MDDIQNSTEEFEIEEVIDEPETSSIDDFIKELEAKEKDLHISTEMVVEVEDTDVDGGGFDYDEIVRREAARAIEAYKDHPVLEQPVGIPRKGNGVAFDSDEVLRLREQVEKLETERATITDVARRSKIDFDNFRKRTERERNETFNQVLVNLAKQMLPVLDNMSRALDSTKDIGGDATSDFRHFIDGVFLVNQQLIDVLEEMGVQPILSIGEPFDPHLHDAVATEENSEFEHNTVIAEILRGYRIGEKVIRPAMVKVSALPGGAGTTPINDPDFLEDPDQDNSSLD